MRREIQRYILEKNREGKSGEDVLKRLNFIYGSREPYSKYKRYFESWVNNIFRRDSAKEDQER